MGFGFESMGHKEGLSPEAKAAIEELQSHCSATPLECAKRRRFIALLRRFKRFERPNGCEKVCFLLAFERFCMGFGPGKPLRRLFGAAPWVRYSLGMGLNYQQLLKNVPMGPGGA